MKHSRDHNHGDIQAAYENMGCSVFDASKVGDGFPDLVVGIAGVTNLVEIKAAKGKLRKSQTDFNDAWRGGKPVVVRCVADVILHVAACRKWPHGLAALCPGPLLVNQRQPVYRSEAMREAVRDLACTLSIPGICRGAPASEAAHLNSQWAGKGMGHKSADVVAAACHWCHAEIDNGKTLSREDREYYLMRGVILTHIALLNEGRLVLAKPRR